MDDGIARERTGEKGRVMAENSEAHLTREERIRIRVQWLSRQGITVTMATAKRLNVSGMDEVIDAVSRNLRLGAE